MPELAVDMLAAAPPQVAKQWGLGKAFGDETLATGRAGRLQPPRSGLQSAWWATPELVDQVATITARQNERDEELSLVRARILSEDELDEGSNGTIEVSLYDKEQDQEITGFFKPVSGIDDEIAGDYGQYGVSSIIHEAAAWQFAKALGEEYEERVAPCVLTVHDGEFGSIGKERPGRPYGGSMDPEQVNIAGFFDALIRQQDRHSGNYLVDGAGNLYLIDHGFSFSHSDEHLNQAHLQRIRFETSPSLTDRERAQLQRLLASDDLLGLRRMIDRSRAEELANRASLMLSTGRVLRDEYIY